MDLQELLNDLEISYRTVGEHHHATHGWLQIDCIYCSPSSGKFRLGLNPQSGAANCWTCGTHSLREVLYELTGTNSRHFLKDIHFDFSHLPPPSQKIGKLKLPEGLGPLLPIHLNYLQFRKFNSEVLTKLWGVRGFEIHHKYSWRLFIPLIYCGEIVSFLTRSLVDREPRYLNADPEDEKYPLKNLLFGEDYVRNSIIICEGCFDVFRIGPGAVATMGIGYTKEQLAKMVNYPIRVICFDSEPEAQKRAKELAQELDLLSGGGETINIELESGKDPAEASEEEIQEIRRTFLGE